MILLALTVSLLTCNLGIVLELTGGFSATALAYILPPLCYLKLAGGSLFQLNKLKHWACLLFGLLIMVVSTFYSLQKIVLGGPESDTSGAGAAACDL